MRLLVRTNTRVQVMEAKIDTLADNLSNLMMFMKKVQSGQPDEHTSGRPRIGHWSAHRSGTRKHLFVS